MKPSTVEEFKAMVEGISAAPGYTAPAAFALGVARISRQGDGTKVLDTYYPVVNLGENLGSAAVLSSVVGRTSGSGTHELDSESLARALDAFTPFLDDGGNHANLDVLRGLAWGDPAESALPVRTVPVVTFIDDLEAAPLDAHDVYLRLHLISHRRVRPHGVSLDGAFGLLANVVWTNLGPADPDGFEAVRIGLRTRGIQVNVTSVDKFPRMTDYVVPSGVRIADADRVRLGAHLAEGTTVMHEGFVNFNAGTLGSAMVEGRISAGVVVGDHSDIGGGASIMGTLSGGGKEVISVGERCLLGANAGIGISLGDECIVEAGLYVTAGTRVSLPDGIVVKAAALSGRSGLLFRRNSQTGAVEVLDRGGAWDEGLNAALHKND